MTRGPTLTAGEKRLAVRTEDHPLDYLEFEGNIPKGEYGGGTMIVWDRGTWTPEFDPQLGLAKGHLAFTLDGSRLKGRWHLVRIRPKPGEKTEPWLLFKSEDEFARKPGDPEITEEETTSGAERADLGGDRRAGSGARRPRGASQGEARAQIAAARRRQGARRAQEACCRPSSSRASPRRASGRRAARNGCTRSSTTAIASRRASTAARSSF